MSLELNQHKPIMETTPDQSSPLEKSSNNDDNIDLSLSDTSPDRLSTRSSKSSTLSSVQYPSALYAKTPSNVTTGASSLMSQRTESKNKERVKPSFNYDLDVFKLCQRYLQEKNHHGLALIARQRGLPPFLRFKIWPILLKYHPYVVKPSIQPDNDNKSSEVNEEELLAKIKKDLNKYLMRLKYSKIDLIKHDGSNANETKIESIVFEILQNSILKFILKWGKIIKYDSALTWIALGLAEWFPPIPKTSWVLVGRDLSSQDNNSIKDLFIDYSNYIDNIPGLNEYLQTLIDDEIISNMSFHDVYERLVLVLLHCPSNKLDFKKTSGSGSGSGSTENSRSRTNSSNGDTDGSSSDSSSRHDNHKNTLTTETFINLPMNGGSIEERVTYFIYIFRKLLPELSDYFNEEQILNKFGSNDDEWLIWWLKYCGSKVWSRLDRGKIWDLLIGFKFRTNGKNYNESLQLDLNLLNKLGNNDNFWSLNFDSINSSSFMDLSNLTIDKDQEDNEEVEIPFPQINPHIQLIFITLALLKSKEHTLIELDQHEIRQYLSRLPTNSYNLTNKYHIFKQKIDKKREEQSSKSSRSSTINDIHSSVGVRPQSPTVTDEKAIDQKAIDHSPPSNYSISPDSNHHNIISNDSINNHSIDFMDNIINEAGELWRQWLWLEQENI